MDSLTEEQKKFLEDCELKFSERFTESDPEYKKVLDNGIPPPPIMYPWYARSRFNNRDRPHGGGRFNRQDNYNRGYNRGYQHNDYGNRNQSRHNYRERPY